MRIAICLLICAIMLAVVWGRAQMIRQGELLPVAFEHMDHDQEECVLCHHNFQDDTGFDSCYSCHKHDEEVALLIEPMFHDFCRGCHVEKAQFGEKSGPFRVCRECHNDSGRMSQNLGKQ